MFAGINVCVFETFAVTSGLVNYLGAWIMFAGIYFCDLKMVAKFANKSLANINEFTVVGNHAAKPKIRRK